MTIDIGITGLGSSKRFHLPILNGLDKTKVVAACDVDKSTLADIDASNKYTDHSRMVKTEQLDFVIIATPPSIRVKLVESAAQQGIPILIEKPTALAVETVDTLIQIRDEYDVPISATQNYRYFTVIEETVRRVSNGVIGNVTSVDVTWSEHKDHSGAELGQEEWVSELVGGAISEALPHPCYLGLAFTGTLSDDISIIWRKYKSTEWPDGLSIQTKDIESRLLSVRFLTQAEQNFHIQIHGTDGLLHVDAGRGTISVTPTDADQKRTIEATPSDDIPEKLSGSGLQGHYRIFQRFIESLGNNNMDVPTTLEEDRDVVKVLEKAEARQ